MGRLTRIAVFMGGTSDERKVSLLSGQNVLRNLDHGKYRVSSIEILRDGSWRSNGKVVTAKSLKGEVDVAFLALHGPGGEDGTVQAILDSQRIPYTFSGAKASRAAMDKSRAKSAARAAKIPVAMSVRIKSRLQMGKLSALAGEKFAVKPNSLGSSLGVRIVDSRKLKPTVELALRKYGEVLVEKFLDGPEFSVPVLGNARPLALPVIEIVPRKGKFFDYQSKYQAGGSDEIVPARIPAALSEQMQHHAMAVHMALGCRGLTRTDLIVANGVPYFLEINTIPGLTTASLAPKSAAAAGIKFPQLLDKLIRLANYK